MDRLFNIPADLEDEAGQLRSALEALGLFRTSPDAGYNRWTRAAAELLDAPVSLFSVIDVDRQVFRSQHGRLHEPWRSAGQTPLSHSFCKTVRDTGQQLVVSDARSDSRVAGNKAIDEMDVASYLGSPVTMPGGRTIAALCVIDNKPRQWSEQQCRTVATLAEAISLEIAYRIELSRRRAAENQLERVLEHLNFFTAMLSLSGDVIWTNQPAEEGTSSAGRQMRLEDLPIWRGNANVRQQLDLARAEAERGEVARFEAVIGEEPDAVAYEVTLSPMTTGHDEDSLALMTAVDITQRMQNEKRRQVLMEEMAHRFRNVVSVITTVASQTLSISESLQDADSKLRQRLQALARSHQVLLGSDWHGADLRQIINHELGSFGEQCTVTGEALILGPQEAQTFALIAHELATNACKYGALTVPAGRVEVRWQTLPDGRVEFEWIETNGPSVKAPESRGFGSTIIENIAKAQFGGTAELTYAPTGFTYRLTWSGN